jgi:Dolichyl-phosphate-mannose-protein mannosyltransferase
MPKRSGKQKQTQGAARVEKVPSLIWWLIFSVVVTVCIVVRIRFLDLPLERDEGEYAYVGQLLLQGHPPYKFAYNMKFPGTYAAYALIMLIFGQTTIAIHLGYLLLNLSTVAVIVLLGRQLFSLNAGLAAGATYAAMSINPSVLGPAAHATHFVVLPALLGCLFLARGALVSSKLRVFSVGLLFGLAGLMKQPGYFFAAFGVFYLACQLVRNGVRWQEATGYLTLFGIGVALPIMITAALLLIVGNFDKFWFWTVVYARAYGSLNSFPAGMRLLGRNWSVILDHHSLAWGIAVIGLLILVFAAEFKRERLFLLVLGMASLCAMSVGLYFREHYFVLVLPIAALLVGVVVRFTETRRSYHRLASSVLALLVLVAVLIPFITKRTSFFTLPLDAVSRARYGVNPFPEARQIANFIKSRTAASDTIAILGSEPEIYFYAQRRSATGYIYMYPAVENHPLAPKMQQEIMDEIETAQPKYLVLVGITISWLRSIAGTKFQRWANEYCQHNYVPVGVVNITSEGKSDYYLPIVGAFPSVSQHFVVIYERRSIRRSN